MIGFQYREKVLHILHERPTLWIVGDSEVFFETLKGMFPDVERISIDVLKLDSATLK